MASSRTSPGATRTRCAISAWSTSRPSCWRKRWPPGAIPARFRRRRCSAIAATWCSCAAPARRNETPGGGMTAPHQFFAPSYRIAREKFLAAAAARGADCLSFEHPEPGLEGEMLATDVALIGDPAARRVLVMTSATHGAEGFCGSGVACGLMASGQLDPLPRDLRLVLIHAVNPYGFSWLQRETEDNVDLNRNFVDFAAALPANPGYARLHEVVAPRHWTPATVEARRAAFDRFAATAGRAALQEAITGGQYSHADGLFFGGKRATWSNAT